MNGMDITREMTIEELIERYPQASGFFLRFGIKCFTCSGIIWGTIEEALRRHGVEDIDGAVAELRRHVSEEGESEKH
jgi:hybrid cluster-associated redox disulfide protein